MQVLECGPADDRLDSLVCRVAVPGGLRDLRCDVLHLRESLFVELGQLLEVAECGSVQNPPTSVCRGRIAQAVVLL